jgi:hypothetical protein
LYIYSRDLVVAQLEGQFLGFSSVFFFEFTRIGGIAG